MPARRAKRLQVIDLIVKGISRPKRVAQSAKKNWLRAKNHSKLADAFARIDQSRMSI